MLSLLTFLSYSEGASNNIIQNHYNSLIRQSNTSYDQQKSSINKPNTERENSKKLISNNRSIDFINIENIDKSTSLFQNSNLLEVIYTLILSNNTLLEGNIINTAANMGFNAIAYDPANGYMYVTNFNSGTVSVINDMNEIGNVSLGTYPDG
ncbi:MAG: YncE family protein, partial [Thermoplasmata archaeon]